MVLYTKVHTKVYQDCDVNDVYHDSKFYDYTQIADQWADQTCCTRQLPSVNKMYREHCYQDK